MNELFDGHRGRWAAVGLGLVVVYSVILISDAGWYVWALEAVPIALGWRLIGSWIDEGKKAT